LNGRGFLGSGRVDLAADDRHNVEVVTDVRGDADKAKSEQLITEVSAGIEVAAFRYESSGRGHDGGM
jgi:hypothetical protein